MEKLRHLLSSPYFKVSALTTTSGILLGVGYKHWKEFYSKDSWRHYYKKTANKFGAPSAVKEAAKWEGIKVWDLGAGAGAAALELGQKGAKVTATDMNEEAIQLMKQRADNLKISVNALRHDISKGPLPTDEKFEIVNAEDVLSFVKVGNKRDMSSLFHHNIARSVTDSGCVYGTFFGPNHSWCRKKDTTCYSEEDVQEILKNSFVTCQVTRSKTVLKTTSGETVDWDEIRFQACSPIKSQP